MILPGEAYRELTAIEITNEALFLLKQRNVTAWRQNNHATRGRQNNVKYSITDIIGYHDVTGQAHWIEVKKIGDTLKPKQIAFMLMAGKSCICMVATQQKSETVLVDFLDYYSKYKHK